MQKTTTENQCEGCDGSGIRPNSTNHSGVEIPKEFIVVERCDYCEKYESDQEAAKAYSTEGVVGIFEKPANNSTMAICARVDN